jgi:hypothetical protein
MTTLLKQAIERLRQLPEDMQDRAAQALLFQLDDQSDADDREQQSSIIVSATPKRAA